MQIHNFVTLFSSAYLPQGLALYKSLLRHGGDFHLWIICIDLKTFETLSELNLPYITPLQLSQFESPELLAAKQSRTLGEYCWTLTPFVFDFVLSVNPKIELLTYLDADVWFRKNPQLILDYLYKSKKKILITDHGFAPEYDLSDKAGQYCVQFLTVKNFPEALELIRHWQKQCLEWCYNRFENGQFGDQKYLDKWPEDYPELVYVLENQGLTLAPWNAIRFPYGNSALYHFHGLKITKEINASTYVLEKKNEHYRIPDVLEENVYAPYIKDLQDAINLMNSNFVLAQI